MPQPFLCSCIPAEDVDKSNQKSIDVASASALQRATIASAENVHVLWCSCLPIWNTLPLKCLVWCDRCLRLFAAIPVKKGVIASPESILTCLQPSTIWKPHICQPVVMIAILKVSSHFKRSSRDSILPYGHVNKLKTPLKKLWWRERTSINT